MKNSMLLPISFVIVLSTSTWMTTIDASMGSARTSLSSGFKKKRGYFTGSPSKIAKISPGNG